jgi:hypothetical protein
MTTFLPLFAKLDSLTGEAGVGHGIC